MDMYTVSIKIHKRGDYILYEIYKRIRWCCCSVAGTWRSIYITLVTRAPTATIRAHSIWYPIYMHCWAPSARVKWSLGNAVIHWCCVPAHTMATCEWQSWVGCCLSLSLYLSYSGQEKSTRLNVNKSVCVYLSLHTISFRPRVCVPQYIEAYITGRECIFHSNSISRIPTKHIYYPHCCVAGRELNRLVPRSIYAMV